MAHRLCRDHVRACAQARRSDAARNAAGASARSLSLDGSVRTISTRNQRRIADVGTVTSEVLGAMKMVQAFNQQNREVSRSREAVERVFATARRRIDFAPL